MVGRSKVLALATTTNDMLDSHAVTLTYYFTLQTFWLYSLFRNRFSGTLDRRFGLMFSISVTLAKL